MPPLSVSPLWMAPGETPSVGPIPEAGPATGLSRRSFLHLLGGSLAMAALHACRAPAETVRPYVRPPRDVSLKAPLYYATALHHGGFAEGVLVESHQGRPTKVEGNPDHPASLGATDPAAQAALWTLYDRARSGSVTYRGRPRDWAAFRHWLLQRRAHWQATRGRGLRLLSGPVGSPTLAAQLAAVLRQFPEARWDVHDPLYSDEPFAATRLACGRTAQVQIQCDRAAVIVGVDADPIGDWPGRLHHARNLARGRRVRQGQSAMSRLYAIESTPTLFGAWADQRLPLAADRLDAALRQVARALGLAAPGPDVLAPAWIAALADDLQAHRGRSLVLVGHHQSAHVQALALALNAHLGNLGATVALTAPVLVRPQPGPDPLSELVHDMEAGRVETLLVLNANPCYTAPADVPFVKALARVGELIHTGLYVDETGSRALWHVPASHPLESWSDGRAFDGTASVIQPLIAPLFGGRTDHEVLDALLGLPERSGDARLQRTWGLRLGTGDDRRWQEVLSLGVIPGTALPLETPTVAIATVLAALPALAEPDGLEVTFRPDPVIGAGDLAPNAWLQELPKPLSKLTWDNAALISPGLAERLGLVNGDVVTLGHGGRRLTLPVWLHPGQPDDSVALSLGYGRTHAGPVATGIGTDVYPFRPADRPWALRGVTLEPTHRHVTLASPQGYDRMHGRELVMWADLTTFRKDPTFARTEATTDPEVSLYPEWPYPRHRWGLSVDLGTCTGCSACVVACQAENNIPVVGKQQVAIGRIMHWLRIDRYYQGPAADPLIHMQPVPCQHCEKAPCELVCPVEATVHSSEGLNDMVYNRCVGTRYCSNNCPYKVRRFNFLTYAETTGLAELRANPEVTIRSRGVMEKCTYCVQRIDQTRIQAQREGRPIRDGEIQTACQQACPTQALVFGDLADPGSRAARLRHEPTTYSLLGDLNTRPRTTYLAKVRNPHPGLVAT